MDIEKWSIVAVLKHLELKANGSQEKSDVLLQVRKLLVDAFELNETDLDTLYPTNGLSLPEVYMAGRKVLLENESVAVDPAFVKFLNRLKATKFFAGVEEGSEEYQRRVEKARKKFDERPRGAPESPTTVPTTQNRELPVVNEKARAEADALKLEGNAQLKASEFSKAAETYSKCISLDGTNAIYYGNRAAAKMHMKEYASAVDDCKLAISIDSGYARAHERLASAYRSLSMEEAEMEALETGIRLHPNNAQLKKMIDDAKARKVPATAAPAGMPDFSGLGGPGGMPDLESLAGMASSMGLPNLSPDMIKGFLDSPMGAQMAQAMAGNNPQMAAMMDAVKANPAMMSQAMEAMKNNPAMMAQAMDAMMDGAGPDAAGDGANGGSK